MVNKLYGLIFLLPLLPLLAAFGVHAAGAIAVDDDASTSVRDVGYGIGFGETREDAVRIALHQCRVAGHENCKVKVRFDKCGAYAASANYYGIGTGTTLARAESMAIEECGRSWCRVVI